MGIKTHALIYLRSRLGVNAFLKNFGRPKTEALAMPAFLLLLMGGLFVFFSHGFDFFKNHEPFGPLLLHYGFYLFNLILLVMTLLSSAVCTHSLLFQNREMTYLESLPLSRPAVYFFKLADIFRQSAWAAVFLALPFILGFSLYHETRGFIFVSLGILFYLNLFALGVLSGSILTLLFFKIFPKPRTRRIALGSGLVMVLFAWVYLKPQGIAHQGSLGGILTGYLPALSFAKSAWLPSAWVTKGLLLLSAKSGSAGTAGSGWLYFFLLVSHTLFAGALAYGVSFWAFPKTSASSFGAEKNGKFSKPCLSDKIWDWLTWSAPLTASRREWPSAAFWAFFEKDWKLFIRNASQRSQFLIFFGLLFFYFANLRNFDLQSFDPFWKHLIFVLNTSGTYLILSSFIIRFIFPLFSLDGNKAWLTALSAHRPWILMTEKFLFGVCFSLLFTLPLILIAGWMLKVTAAVLLFNFVTGILSCLVLTASAVGIGAAFPAFRETSPSGIVASTGGVLLLICHLIYIAAACVLLYAVKNPAPAVYFLAVLVTAGLSFGFLKWGKESFSRTEYF